jgi:hypothetical protein
MAGTRASGFGRRGNHTKASDAAIGTAVARTHGHGTHGTAGSYEGEGHQMSSLSHGSTTTNGNHGTGLTGLTGNGGIGLTGRHGNVGPQTDGQYTELLYPDHDSQGAGRNGMNPISNVV